MPPLEVFAIYGTMGGGLLLTWEIGKSFRRNYQNRNHVWISFTDRDEAAAAIERVNRWYLDGQDVSNCAEIAAGINGANKPYFKVCVPWAMLDVDARDEALAKFQRDAKLLADNRRWRGQVAEADQVQGTKTEGLRA